MAENIAEIAGKLTDTQKGDLLSGEWYLASCDHCGWLGPSKECGTDHGIGDDSNVYCPKCDRSGADIGKVAEKFDAALRNYLQKDPPK